MRSSVRFGFGVCLEITRWTKPVVRGHRFGSALASTMGSVRGRTSGSSNPRWQVTPLASRARKCAECVCGLSAAAILTPRESDAPVCIRSANCVAVYISSIKEPTKWRSKTEHLCGAQSIAHLRVLAPPIGKFAGVTNELTEMHARKGG
jgi:hypothetical protein